MDPAAEGGRGGEGAAGGGGERPSRAYRYMCAEEYTKRERNVDLDEDLEETNSLESVPKDTAVLVIMDEDILEMPDVRSFGDLIELVLMWCGRMRTVDFARLPDEMCAGEGAKKKKHTRLQVMFCDEFVEFVNMGPRAVECVWLERCLKFRYLPRLIPAGTEFGADECNALECRTKDDRGPVELGRGSVLDLESFCGKVCWNDMVLRLRLAEDAEVRCPTDRMELPRHVIQGRGGARELTQALRLAQAALVDYAHDRIDSETALSRAFHSKKCKTARATEAVVKRARCSIVSTFEIDMYVHENDCAICHQSLGDADAGQKVCMHPGAATVEAMHMFHWTCFDEYAQGATHGVTCPLCRGKPERDDPAALILAYEFLLDARRFFSSMM